jgi:AbrB family looped-hinge helix DNA binding protein
MTYTSVVTSKGTITLPARIRKELGITEGKKVDIVRRGETITIKPQSGWDEFFATAAELREKMRKMHGSSMDVDALMRHSDETKTREYREKYLSEE